MESILVIPIRSLSDGKSRLSATSTNVDRKAVMTTCLEQIINTSRLTDDIKQIVLVSGSEEIRDISNTYKVDFHFSPLPLNESLMEYRDSHIKSGDTACLLVVLGDLPLIKSLESTTEALNTRPLVLGCDRHGRGTNILGIANGIKWEYMFGENSFRNHMQQANLKGFTYRVIRKFDIGLDLDDNSDIDLMNKSLNKKGAG